MIKYTTAASRKTAGRRENLSFMYFGNITQPISVLRRGMNTQAQAENVGVRLGTS